MTAMRVVLTTYAKMIINEDIPTSFEPRTISTCHDHDIVCEMDWFSGIQAHFSYQDEKLQSLGQWTAATVKNGAGQPVPDCGIPQ
jgi:hypothetical protein